MIKGYAYVPKGLVASILENGYLSARKQAKLFPELHSTLIRKYKQQLKRALSNYPSLKKDVKGLTPIQQTLHYLDWRDEKTLKGSKAIYFLFAPIPDEPDIRNFIRKHRDDFLKDRVLLEMKVSRDYIVVEGRSGVDYHKKDEQWWIKKWRNVMKKYGSKRGQLWFTGIPHAYIVPRSGKVPPSRIKVIDNNKLSQ